MDLLTLIRTIPDFPRPGIGFRDITPLLARPEALREVIEAWAGRFGGAGVGQVLAIESRGFLFGAPLALRLGAGVVPLRKPGKLPATTWGEDHDLEYGTSRLEMHVDALHPGQRVLLVDDVLATGGTLGAAWRLARRAGAEVVGAAVVIELAGLDGRAQLAGLPVAAVMELPA
jgi:adenine phosphoribosyltransferase